MSVCQWVFCVFFVSGYECGMYSNFPQSVYVASYMYISVEMCDFICVWVQTCVYVCFLICE